MDVFFYEAFAEEALEEKARQSAAQVEHFLKNGAFIWPVPESNSFVR